MDAPDTTVDPVSPDPDRVVYRDEAQQRADEMAQDVSDYPGVEAAVDAVRDDDRP